MNGTPELVCTVCGKGIPLSEAWGDVDPTNLRVQHGEPFNAHTIWYDSGKPDTSSEHEDAA